MGEVIYDKAKYHYESNDFPLGLSEFQAFIHTGFFLGWLIEQDLISDEFKRDFKSEIEKFREGQISAPQLFQKMDGVLSSMELTEAGNKFAKAYFDFHTGQYLQDYEKTFSDVDNIYRVHDTPENYQRIKTIIAKRFQELLVDHAKEYEGGT